MSYIVKDRCLVFNYIRNFYNNLFICLALFEYFTFNLIICEVNLEEKHKFNAMTHSAEIRNF